MATQCNTCKGIYEPMGLDGVPYYHVCPPITVVAVLRDGVTQFVPLADLKPADIVVARRGDDLVRVAVADLLPPYRVQINAQSWIYITIGVFIPFLYLANFTTSLLSRRIRWRGIRYELISQNETRVLTPQ